MTFRRMAAVSVAVTVAVVGTFGVRTAIGLAKLFHTDPVSAFVQVLRGKDGSAIQNQNVNLKRINIALYGYGGPPHDGPYLTDSIMVVSIQPEVSGPPRIAEISVPRDWWVHYVLPAGKQDGGRINAAYSDGMSGMGPVPSDQPGAGASVADPTLSHLLGLQIDYFVGIDFSAFQASVDAVGGIDINVPNSFTDWQYPAGECVNGYDCGYMTVHFNAGMQHMDGRRALIYTRSRHGDNGEGSDFARSKRQQLVVAAVKQKALSIGGIGKLPDLLSALGDHVKTNLTISDAEALYDLVKDVDPASVTHVSIDNTNFLYDCGYPVHCGAWVMYARDSSFQSLDHYISSVFVDPTLTGKGVHVIVEDGSGTGNGASTRWAKLFGALGWKLDDQGGVDRVAKTQVIDATGGSGGAVASWFASYFGVTVTTPPTPSAVVAAGGTVGTVTIVLGQDEERSFNNDPGVGN